SEGLKRLLPGVFSRGAEPLPWLRGSFPSGHATIAMALALAALVAAPEVARGLVAVGGACYAVAVGIVLVALGQHYPSDVAAGFLVAGSWAGLVDVARRWLERRRRRPSASLTPATRGAAVALALAAALAAVAALALHSHPDALTHGPLGGSFYAAAAAITA